MVLLERFTSETIEKKCLAIIRNLVEDAQVQDKIIESIGKILYYVGGEVITRNPDLLDVIIGVMQVSNMTRIPCKTKTNEITLH